MTVLLVDDQMSVLSGILSGVDWDRLEVASIKTACSTFEAREILLHMPIDLMLCDIEMPVENGLSLLRWVRKQGMDLECIFLTAHADFLYAKEAIQLGSFDYLLQPARYEDIQQAVERAIIRIRTAREEKKYSSYGRAAFRKKDDLFHGVLCDWFSGKRVFIDDIMKELQDIEVPVQADTPVFFALIQLLRWHSEPWNTDNWSYALNNILSELMEQSKCKLMYCCPDKTSLGFFVYSEYRMLLPYETFLSQLRRVLLICGSEQIGCDVAIYTQNSFPIRELAGHAAQIQRDKQDNVSQKSDLFMVDQPVRNESVTFCDSFHLQRWEKLLNNGHADIVEEDMIRFLHGLDREGLLNKHNLVNFHQDFQQIFFSAFYQKQLAAHELMNRENISALNEKASDSLENMIELIQAVTSCCKTMSPPNMDTEDTIAKIEKYVQSNLDKVLHCSEVADAVFMNQDYVTRIFKQKKGISLKEYIVREKMYSAETLLKTTTLPVGVIASKVGYDNFSHFSQVYKKEFGVSPSDHRK